MGPEEIDNPLYGSYLKFLIKDTVKTQVEFLRRIKVSKTYLVQVINSQIKPPSPERQLEITQKLGLNDDESYEFYDRAASERDELPADIAMYIQNHPEVILMIREAKRTNQCLSVVRRPSESGKSLRVADELKPRIIYGYSSRVKMKDEDLGYGDEPERTT